MPVAEVHRSMRDWQPVLRRLMPTTSLSQHRMELAHGGA